MQVKLSLYLVAILAIVSCGAPSQGGSKAIKRVKCEVVHSAQTVSSERSYSGRIDAAKDVNLSFRVAGVVERVLVTEGDFVESGDVVAELDSRDYELQLQATTAEYNSIKGEVDRIVALYEEQSVAENDYEKAINGLKQITAKLQSHRNAVSDTKLKAPFDGYVQSVKFDKGEALSAGMPIVSYISATAPRIIINIPAEEYLRRGELLSAVATLQSLPGREFKLRQIGVAQKANLNQLYESHFEVEPCGGEYPTAGMLAMISLSYRAEKEQYLVPVSAIVERDGASYLWLIEDGAATLRGVEVGSILRSGRAIVESGLSSGDVVITAGVSNLKEGERVEMLPAESKSNIGNIL